jgi:hypothetical protein
MVPVQRWSGRASVTVAGRRGPNGERITAVFNDTVIDEMGRASRPSENLAGSTGSRAPAFRYDCLGDHCTQKGAASHGRGDVLKAYRRLASPPRLPRAYRV